MTHALTAISPLDGRYAAKCAALRPIFSELGLMQRRVLVEVRWLAALADAPEVAEVPPLGETARAALEAVAVDFMFPGEQVRTAYVEVGDFAAGQAFLQMAAR